MGSFRALAINKKLPAADKTTFGVKCEQFLMVGCSSITLSAGLVLLTPKAGRDLGGTGTGCQDTLCQPLSIGTAQAEREL